MNNYYPDRESAYVDLIKKPHTAQFLVYSPYIGEYEFYKIFFDYMKRFSSYKDNDLIRNKFITTEMLRYGLLTCPHVILYPYFNNIITNYNFKINISTEEAMSFFHLDLQPSDEFIYTSDEFIYKMLLRLAFHADREGFYVREYEKEVENFLMINYDPVVMRKLNKTGFPLHFNTWL